MAGGRPVKFETVEQMNTLVDGYFASEDARAKENGWKLPIYTMSGLALALGLSRQSLINYREKDEFLDTLKEATQRVEAMVEMRLQTGVAQTGHIFNLKNNFAGWKDTVHNESSTPSVNINTEPTTVEEAAKLYQELVKKVD